MELFSLTKLESLMLQNNKISIVPREIGALKSLRGLFLGDNRIVAIPAEVGSLRSLTTLGVRLHRTWRICLIFAFSHSW